MRWPKFTAIAAATLLLTGCWDKIELNDRAYVNSIGIDKASMQGKQSPGDGFIGDSDHKFQVGVCISDLSAIEGNDKGGEEETENKSIKKSEGLSLSAAIRDADENSSQRLFFGHTKAAFLGENLLKDKLLFMEALDALERDKELSRKIIVLATEGDVFDTLGFKPKGEPSVGIFADKFYKENRSGSTFSMNLEELLIQLRSNENTVIPKIKTENEEIKIGGGAVIKNLELCGFLNETEMRGYLWQNGKNNGAKVIVEYNGVGVPFNTLRHSKGIEFYENDGHIVMEIRLDIDGSVDEYIFGSPVFDEGKLYEIEGLVAAKIKAEISLANAVLQKSMKVDAADINRLLMKKNYSLWKKYNGNWQEAFEEMSFDVGADVKIRSIGVIR